MFEFSAQSAQAHPRLLPIDCCTYPRDLTLPSFSSRLESSHFFDPAHQTATFLVDQSNLLVDDARVNDAVPWRHGSRPNPELMDHLVGLCLAATTERGKRLLLDHEVG